MTFINKLIYLKNICCPCLVQAESEKFQSQNSTPLLQMKQINKPQHPLKQEFCSQKSNQISTSQINCTDENKQKNKMTKSLTISNRISLKAENNKFKNQIGQILEQDRSDSSFHTVKSSLSRPISRRQFKVLKSSSLFGNSRNKNQDQFYSINQSDDTNFKAHIVKFTDEFQQNKSQSINILIKKEYQKLQQFQNIKVNQITKLKINSKDNFDSLVHKIQDYYTFYFDYEQQSKDFSQSQLYIGKNNNFMASFHKTSSNKTFDFEKNCKYMSLCIIQHINVSPLKFIQWFNEQEIQTIYHNFNSIKYAQMTQISQDFPILIVQQFSEHLIGKQKLYLIKQIQNVKFQNQEAESVLQIDYSVADEKKCFQRLIRIDSTQNGKVQIYTESSQNIKGDQQKYFKSLWIQFQERLYKDKIIKSQFKLNVN